MKLARDEKGFTLVEALVTLVMMLVVFFALHSIFEAGVRAVSLGGDETEAVSRARLGMERMEREIRTASPYGANDRHLFFAYGTPAEPRMPLASRITFGYDRDGKCGLLKVKTGGACEIDEANPGELVSYYVNDSGNIIRRSNNLYSSLTGGVSDLRFAYFDTDGSIATSEDEIHRIDITLTVEVGESEQTLKSSVAPRSRSQ